MPLTTRSGNHYAFYTGGGTLLGDQYRAVKKALTPPVIPVVDDIQLEEKKQNDESSSKDQEDAGEEAPESKKRRVETESEAAEPSTTENDKDDDTSASNIKDGTGGESAAVPTKSDESAGESGDKEPSVSPVGEQSDPKQTPVSEGSEVPV